MKILDFEALKMYDAKLKSYIDNIDFVGTLAEVNTAIENGVITEGMKVYITDDYDSENYYTTLLSSSWVGNTAPYIYDLGIEDGYDFEITLSNTVTAEQFEALQDAQITANGVDNLLRAYGDKPTIDIPVIVRKWVAD